MLSFRHSFLQTIFWLGLVAQADEPLRARQTHMGMPVDLSLYGVSASEGERVLTAFSNRVVALEAILSGYQSDSELRRFNATAGRSEGVRLSQSLFHVLSFGQSLAAESKGAFDVTVGPLVQVWRLSRARGQVPSTALIEQARKRVGYQLVERREFESVAVLTVPKMRIDLDAIAKGYILDEGMDVLRRHGVESALIDAGGDVRVSGPPPGRAGWTIRIGGMDGEAVVLRDAAVATSGDAVQYMEKDGVRYSHIIDPRTGWGVTNQCQATVIASTAMEADGLASWICVVGIDGASEVLKKRVRAHAVVAQGDRVWKSEGAITRRLK